MSSIDPKTVGERETDREGEIGRERENKTPRNSAVSSTRSELGRPRSTRAVNGEQKPGSDNGSTGYESESGKN